MINIDYIMGLPPENILAETNVMVKASMPIARIYPGLPSFQKGYSLFTRRDAFKDGKSSYLKLLNAHNYNISETISGGSYIPVAFQADSFPTDSFTNEYGENFLQKFTDVVSEGAASVAQMFGERTASDAGKKLWSVLRPDGVIGDVAEKGGNIASEKFREVLNLLPGAKSHINVADALLAGGRLDFPMLWKGSAFQPSYTMTVRLYNPNPYNSESTKKFIIGPIAALMLLAIPITADGVTYSYPFIHRIEAPGIYDLDPAFISNITVIKGGDQQQISYKQKLSVVDVRLDFGSLFNSILATNGETSLRRPTLASYLKGMETEKEGIVNYSSVEGSVNRLHNTTRDENVITNSNRENERNKIEITKNKAPSSIELSQDDKNSPSSRIDKGTVSIYTELNDRSTFSA